MKCLYEKNRLGGLVNEHTRFDCVYTHNPPQTPTHHVFIGNWCGNVCQWCSEVLKKKHPSAEVVELPPEKVPRKLRPWDGVRPIGLTLEGD